ncbi:hypothetical protein EDB87DRAFT_1584644 [Lactarius vividus]|nr:hypothetical protein EDB87DRAFT_1584644 [Lactarius vividus]
MMKLGAVTVFPAVCLSPRYPALIRDMPDIWRSHVNQILRCRTRWALIVNGTGTKDGECYPEINNPMGRNLISSF